MSKSTNSFTNQTSKSHLKLIGGAFFCTLGTNGLNSLGQILTFSMTTDGHDVYSHLFLKIHEDENFLRQKNHLVQRVLQLIKICI